MPDDAERLRAGLAALGLSAALAGPLLAYLDLLLRWNRAYNLTAVRDRSAGITRHLLDSLAPLPLLRGPRLLDLGSGAGLPGIPVAVARPDWRVVLLDRSAKRTRFLTQAVLELRLGNVEVVRADMGGYRPDAPFDTITARAVAGLPELHAAAAPVLAPGGRLVALKGRRPDAEMAVLAGGDVSLACQALHVPGLDEPRHAVVLQHVPSAGTD